jgi:cytidylate kinase
VVRNILLVTGVSGAGKSSLSEYLETEFGIPVVSIGGILRQNARAHGYQNLIAFLRTKPTVLEAFEEVWPQVKQEIITKTGPNGITIEGLYIPAWCERIHSLFPRDTIHVINVTSTRHTRANRIAQKRGTSRRAARREAEQLDIAKTAVGLKEMLRTPGIITIRNPARQTRANFFNEAKAKLPFLGQLRRRGKA